GADRIRCIGNLESLPVRANLFEAPNPSGNKITEKVNPVHAGDAWTTVHVASSYRGTFLATVPGHRLCERGEIKAGWLNQSSGTLSNTPAIILAARGPARLEVNFFVS